MILLATPEPPPAGLLRELVRFGVTDVRLAGCAVPEAARAALAASLPRPAAVTALDTPEALDERFLLCDGDCILDYNLARLLADAAAQPGPRLGMREGAGATPSSVAVLDRSVLGRLAPGCSIETGLVPALAAAGALRRTVVPGLPGSAANRPALFLDRDGTINRDLGYVGTRARWEWMDGAIDAVRTTTEAGWHVFVVTNQSGVARGYYDEAALNALHAWMTDELRRAGGNVDDIRFCPFHEAAELARYRRASDWRKPAPGMILDLVAKWRLDPARCVMVGDQPSDMAAARAAGIGGRPFEGGNLLAAIRPLLQAV